MTIGSTMIEAATLPLMSEVDARVTLLRERHVYNVPANWRNDDSDEVLVFTGDPVEAAYCADVIARQDIGVSYRTYVEGRGVEVEGPIEVVLVGIPDTEWVDWRRVEDVFTVPAIDDDERARRYALLMCRVRPARSLVGAQSRGRSG